MLAIGDREELLVEHDRLLYIPEIIVICGAKEVGSLGFRIELGASIQRLEGESIVLVLRRGKGEVVIGLTELGVELDGDELLLLRVGVLVHQEQSVAVKMVESRIIGLGLHDNGELLGSRVVLPGGEVKLGGGLMGVAV